jgi:ATP-dependent DNA ligase
MSAGMLVRRIRADGFLDPCIPSRAPKPPSGSGWVHEVNDGYRLIERRDGDAVRLFTRRGYDWTGRYPAIASAAAKIRAQSFTLDGEAVLAGADGVAVFDALHRRGRVTDAILQAFDLLELDGEDLRPLLLGQRKPGSRLTTTPTRTERWCSGRPACRSAWQRPIDPALPATGSRSRIPTVRR